MCALTNTQIGKPELSRVLHYITLRHTDGRCVLFDALDPHSSEVTARIIEKISRMSPEEACAFLFYRTPGVEETDMLGILDDHSDPQPTGQKQRRATT